MDPFESMTLPERIDGPIHWGQVVAAGFFNRPSPASWKLAATRGHSHYSRSLPPRLPNFRENPRLASFGGGHLPTLPQRRQGLPLFGKRGKRGLGTIPTTLSGH